MPRVPRPQTGSDGRDDCGISMVEALALISEGRDLSRAEARSALGLIMQGQATPAQIGALLMGLRMKGETVDELTGAAEAMREAATSVVTARRPLLDTCGTGGDRAGTVNLSTAVALVAASCGVAVAKHGNRSVSSRCGSADVLEAVGVRIDLTAEQMGRCLDETGFAFLFAPALHPAMRHAIGPRREMGLRTLFNLLGPLTNPALPEYQLLGVFHPGTARQMAGVLRGLGCRAAWVVHGENGWDEVSICGETLVFEVGESIRETRLGPEQAGLGRHPQGVAAGGSARENAAWLEEMLRGERSDPSRDAVLLNAAAALTVAGRTSSLREGVEAAREALAGGAAHALLVRLREVTEKLR